MGSRRDGHVAIITSNYWPEETGIGRIATEFAEFLADRGLDVRVATAMPYYPGWKIRADYRGKIWQTEKKCGSTIYRSWHYVRPSPSTLTRVVHEATLSLVALPSMARVLWKSRVVYLVTPDLSFAFTASLMAWLLRVRRVVVVQDVMPDAAVELGMMTNGLAIRAARWLAKTIYALADEIQTIGEGMRRRIAQAASKSDIRIVPNTIDVNELAPVPRSANEFRRQFVPEGTLAILHSGNMGKKQDLDLLLRTAERLRGVEDVHFYVFGDGGVKQEFLRCRDERGLSNVSHYPLQERAMLPHMLSGADIVLVSQLREVVDIVVPSKLLTSLAAGAMIVAACAEESETARLVRESKGGVVIPAGDDKAFVSVIERIRSGVFDSSACRRAARQFAVAQFSRPAVYGPLVDELIAEPPRVA